VNLRAPFYPVGDHIGIELPGARGLFTTRRGGVSTGAYGSLNLGFLTDDDPQAVARNRAAVEAQVGARLTWTRQVHGARVHRITEPRGAETTIEADGQASTVPGLAPMVLVADCLPIAVAGGGAIGILHAGWRGLAVGVIGEGVRALRELGATGSLTAAIGPGAGPCCYEVGEEVHAAFHGRALTGRVAGDRKLDLKAIARAQLEQAGVSEIYDVALCTICSPAALFYSHRRDRGVTGRQAGLAWLT
jgi:YfiH family protein